MTHGMEFAGIYFFSMFVCNSVSVYLWQKANFGTLRSRDFIFGILHIDLDLYSNIANLNFASAWKCVSVFD